jgi:hypothetical protein
MSKKLFGITGTCLVLIAFHAGANNLFAQSQGEKKKIETGQSIGGKEHDANILGVTIGMDVPTALRDVFVNADRKPGREKPDAKKTEGKDGRDIRVVYKDLPQGELQILFAEGKYVKEIVLSYSKPPVADDLRLPFTSSLGNSTSLVTTQSSDPRGLSERTDTLDGTKEIDAYNATNAGNTDRRRGEALDGARFDDRYTTAFVDNQKLQRIWYRDEKAQQGYRVRVQFVSEKRTKSGANFVVRIIQKVVVLLPEDEKQFRKTLNLSN